MAYEQQLFNIPLAGDILDDLAMAFREIISKVGQFSFFLLNKYRFLTNKSNRKEHLWWISGGEFKEKKAGVKI